MREVDKELLDACWKGRIAEVRKAISRGADVNVKDIVRWPPLHCACYRGRVEIVKLLISKGADVNMKDVYGHPVLYWSCYYGHKEIIKLLVSKGADIGETLRSAIDEQEDKIIVMLLEESGKCEK